MTDEACCTCATLLSSIPPTYDEKTEKPAQYERRLDCCGRAICARCITDNPRFATYCPFCQVSITPTPLPQGLRDPPAYSPPSSPELRTRHAIRHGNQDDPPAYSANDQYKPGPEKRDDSEPAPDVLHFVDPVHDSISSLSLRYGVPAGALRKTNNLYADHLLAARRTVLIPGEYYKGGVSLSPRPIEGEEEETRKSKVRKWQVACKVAEYDIALLYLKQANYDLDLAVQAYLEDEKWEREHPLEASRKGKAKATGSSNKLRWGLAGGLTGQLS